MKLLVVIPAFNESHTLKQVILDVHKICANYDHYKIVVVDDGSTDDTSKIAQSSATVVLRHPINRGLGATIGTGLVYAKEKRVQIMVTLDADGQHDPYDIEKLIKPIINNKSDIVIGSRFLKSNAIPFDRRIIIKLANIFVQLFYGVKTTDSQSGFRAFSKKAIDSIQLRTQGMEVSTELFSEIRSKKLKLQEVPIHVKYTEYSRAKGQPNTNALSIITRLLLRLAR